MPRALPAIDPAPPLVRSRVPLAGAGLALLADPTAAFERWRRELGDTFAVDVFGYRMLCVFSPEGVRNLWALPEAQASKGAGDFALLRHKVPDELFVGRRTRPHDLFARDDVEVYLENLRAAVAIELDELDDAGELELFAWTRRLMHRVGLASWGGIEAAAPRHLDRLVPLLDRLDSSESFVHPHKALWAMATRKRAERRAIAGLDRVFADILAERARAGGDARDDLLAQIAAKWADVPSPERERGIGRDVVLVHMGAQSNLFAATAWTLVHLLERPALLAAVRGGDLDLLDRCSYESIRLRQRSIVLRMVLRETTIADEKAAYRVAPGAFLATTMAVTNPAALPGLDRFDPAHFERRAFARAGELPARELVTTFGHGRHACPAHGFSIAAMRHAIASLVERFELEPLFRDPRPLRRQIGGVARADRPCRVRYAARR
ncbi:MAG: cytochrome P450 [Myxococcota bacterium]|nr:cytochrome P450 [Myxococcales bacterium]